MTLRSLEDDMCSKNPDEILDDYFDHIKSLNLPKCKIKRGKTFFRARKGCMNLSGAIDDCDIEFAYPFYGSDIQSPQPRMSSGGRFNREGTSFLYLASTIKTCVAEIHLEVNQMCSVAKFNCVMDGEYLSLFTNKEDNEINLFYEILTQPIHSEIKYKYHTTQFLSDIIRKMGFSGVIFKSTQGNGKNVICYNPSDYEYVNFSEKMYKAKKIDYLIKPVDEEYKQYTDYRKLLSSYNSKQDEQKEKHFEHISERIKYDDSLKSNKL